MRLLPVGLITQQLHQKADEIACLPMPPKGGGYSLLSGTLKTG
jgi:hypothetical protein